MLVVEKEPQSMKSESYRDLRTNIKYSLKNKNIKTMAVVGLDDEKEKSLVSANLALSFAQSSNSVVVIDCNFRNPSINSIFDISNGYGLSDILNKNKSLEEVINKYNKNLYVISAGSQPLNPADFLERNEMKELLNKLKENFDFIILDTPNLEKYADAKILAANADGTLVIIKSKKNNTESALKSKEILSSVGANILGFVLNDVKS